MAPTRFAEERPVIAKDHTRYTYYPGTQEVPFNAGPNTINRSYSITVDVSGELIRDTETEMRAIMARQ